MLVGLGHLVFQHVICGLYIDVSIGRCGWSPCCVLGSGRFSLWKVVAVDRFYPVASCHKPSPNGNLASRVVTGSSQVNGCDQPAKLLNHIQPTVYRPTCTSYICTRTGCCTTPHDAAGPGPLNCLSCTLTKVLRDIVRWSLERQQHTAANKTWR